MYNTSLKSRHYTIEDLGSSLRITCPSYKNWYQVVVFAWIPFFFLISVLSIVVGLITGLEKGQVCEGILMLLILLPPAIIVGVECSWQVAGKEIVEISKEQMTLRHQIFGWGPSKQFVATEINCEFISYQKLAWWAWFFQRMKRRFANFKLGKIEFNAREQTFRFGASLEMAEAKQVVTTIHERFPQYRYKKYTPK